MTWTRLSDDYADRPALLAVSRSARLLDVEGLLYCNKHGTNGYLPAAALPRITDAADPKADVAELLEAGIWTDADTGWYLDWSDQESAERVKQRREYTAERNRAYRERGELHRRGDHSKCTDRCPHASNDALRDASRAATRPDPSRPKDKGQEGERRPPPADAGPDAPQASDDTLIYDTSDGQDFNYWLDVRAECGHAYSSLVNSDQCAFLYDGHSDECPYPPRHIVHYGFTGDQHVFQPDDSGVSCDACGTGRGNRRHVYAQAAA